MPSTKREHAVLTASLGQSFLCDPKAPEQNIHI